MPRSQTGRYRERPRRAMAGVLVAGLATALLSACSAEGGKPTLTWYVNPDGEATNRATAERCSTDDYSIDVQLLPADASQQRVQAARRLAAKDVGIDLMSLDPVFVPEFANAGFLAEIPEEMHDQATGPDVAEGIANTVKWEDKVYGIPQWANTQVMWYSKSLAEKAGLDMTQPVTWDQIIDAAGSNQGTVGVQAKKYEAYAVWINALIMGAGGQIATDLEAGADAEVTIDSQAGKDAAAVVEKLASSPAAQPDMSNSNEGTVLPKLFEGGGGFMMNWTFVFKGAGYTDEQLKDLGWARYPQTVAGQESRPPVGGIDIGVNAASDDVDYALEAASCITDKESQIALATTDGLMPATSSLYEDPKLTEAYPADLLALFRESLEAGGPRPVSAVWNDMSLAIQASWHPPGSVNEKTPEESQKFVIAVLKGEELV